MARREFNNKQRTKQNKKLVRDPATVYERSKKEREQTKCKNQGKKSELGVNENLSAVNVCVFVRLKWQNGI